MTSKPLALLDDPVSDDQSRHPTYHHVPSVSGVSRQAANSLVFSRRRFPKPNTMHSLYSKYTVPSDNEGVRLYLSNPPPPPIFISHLHRNSKPKETEKGSNQYVPILNIFIIIHRTLLDLHQSLKWPPLLTRGSSHPKSRVQTNAQHPILHTLAAYAVQ